MRIVIICIAAAILLYALIIGISMYFKIHTSKGLVEAAEPFARVTSDTTKTLLVVGDSTGVGVGASSPEDSVAGLLAAYMGATYVENHAVSGALVRDVPSQIEQAKLGHYDLILIQVGGNDIMRFTAPEVAAREVLGSLATLRALSDQVYFIAPGNVGGATLFPWFIRPFYTKRNLAYHEAFAKVADAQGVTYVNLYTPPKQDPFVEKPEIYLAADGLHPSSKGYALWFAGLRKVLTK